MDIPLTFPSHCYEYGILCRSLTFVRRTYKTFSFRITFAYISKGGTMTHLTRISTLIRETISEWFAAIKKKPSHPAHDELLNGLLRNLPVIIYKVNREGIFTLSVGAGLKALNLSDNGLVGMNALDLYKDAASILRRAMAGEKIQFASGVAIQDRELFFESTVFPDPSNEGGIIGFVLDITPARDAESELIKARKELERTVEFLDSSQEISKTGGWEFDVRTDLVHRTRHMKLLLGMTEESTSLQGATVFYEDSDGEAIKMGMKAAVEQQRPYDLELKLKGCDRWFRSIGIPVVKDGKTIRVRGAVMDITDMKLTERQLIAAQKELKRTVELLDTSQEIGRTGGWEYDIIADTVYRTKYMKSLLGIEEESTSLRIGALSYSAESGEIVQQAMAEAISCQKPYDVELKLKGSQKWVRSIGIPIVKDGKTVMVRGALMDITDMKLAQQELIAAKRELEQTVELLNVSQEISKTGGWERDVLTGTVYRTRNIKLLLGITEENISSFRDWPMIYEEESVKVMEESMARALEHQESFDIEIKWKDQERWFSSIGIPIVENGRTIKVRGVLMDITEMKRSRAEILQAKRLAEEAVIAKQQFLSNMSHEIRTPMNAVIGTTHLLLQENPRDDQKENLKILKFSGENLLSLINDILDYSKIESGKIQFEEIAFHLPDFINNIKHSHSLRAEEKGLVFKAKMDSDLPDVVMGDPVRLSQILNNLIGNAIKFTNEGRVIIDLSLNRTVEALTYIDFSVADTGIGIDPVLKDYIFDSFTQASADTTRRFGGTGLGLAITKKLLQLQGSDILLESREGEGSVFSFTLAFRKSSKKPQETGGFYMGMTQDFGSLAGYKILLVEDNEANTVMATKLMQKWELEIARAPTGVEAVDMVAQDHYDLVLMDLQMPRMDGYEATRRIRSLAGERYQQIPIIALTASAMAETKGKVIEAGMNDYISKPFNPAELYAKIVRYLSL